MMKFELKNNHLLTFLLIIGLSLLFFLPPFDPDLGWQLRCGQEIWQRHSLCNQNQFSVLLENYSWTNHYWLYQTVIWPLYQVFGLWGLTILNALLVSSAFFLFSRVIKLTALEKIVAIVLVIFLSWGVFSFGIRSQLFGFFFFSLLLYLTAKIRQNNAIALFCPLAIFFWANIHGGSVILGLILLFFILLSFIFQSANQPRKVLFLASIFFVSVIASFLNPFGLQIYQEAWRHFAGVDLSKLIAEWVPPNPFLWWLIFSSGLGFFIFVLLWGRKRENIIFAFLLLPFILLALKARRNVPFYFLIFLYSLFQLPKVENLFGRWFRNNSLKNELVFLGISLFLLFGLLFRLPLTIHANSSWENYCQDSGLDYPWKAVEFLRRQPPANIFNRYEWGGFLIWQLPEYKVFVDGRMPAWNTPSGKSPYTIYLETLQTQPGWQETLDYYKINWILISPGTFMDLKLKPNPEKIGWQEVYRDQNSVIYKKV